jgi:predicted CXXCH cytochrome family protein
MRNALQCTLSMGFVCASLATIASENSVGFQPPVRAPGGFAPHPAITSIQPGEDVALTWFGLQGPYEVQGTADLDSSDWATLTTANESPASVPAGDDTAFYQVIGAEPNYAGAATCLQCHIDTHNNWANTKHAHAIESLRNIGQEGNSRCVACHTVGYGARTGFQDVDTTPQLAGVQCENCHGPAANHAANPADPTVTPMKTVSAVVCGGCHTGAHHPTFDEWDMSRHGHALAGLKASSHAQDRCLNCHSEDYRYAVANNLPTVPTVETAQLSLECSTCHAPHGGVEQEHLIRKPIDLLCGECHTQGEATLGGNPHHPQFEMLKGIGAFQEDGTPLVQPHPHSLIAKACAQCHVVRHHVDAPNQGNPNVTGHTFNPFDESIDQDLANQYGGCVDCHEITPAFEKRREVFQDLIDSQIADLRPYFTPGTPEYIDPSTLTEEDLLRWESARFNVLYVDADKSKGMHNFENARVALSIAQTVFQSLSPTP